VAVATLPKSSILNGRLIAYSDTLFLDIMKHS